MRKRTLSNQDLGIPMTFMTSSKPKGKMKTKKKKTSKRKLNKRKQRKMKATERKTMKETTRIT